MNTQLASSQVAIMKKGLILGLVLGLIGGFSLITLAQDSLFVDTTGQVGVGTDNPVTTLHVRDPDAQIRVQNNSGNVGTRTLLDLINNGANRFLIRNSDSGSSWAFLTSTNDEFRISDQNSARAEFRVQTGGDVIIQGALTQNSDQNSKQDIVAVDSQQVLNKLKQLNISQWAYKNSDEIRHIGPMAQDFYETFEVGASPVGISSIDTAGVALASIQALATNSDALEALIADQRTQIADLHARMQQLEAVAAKPAATAH